MSHDKIKAAGRKQMEETGEPYSAAGRMPVELLAVLAGHAIVAAWTWRDIRHQPAARIRGSKGLWRVLSAVNTLGSVSYWLIGRRYGRSQTAR
jgi:hypothetical protein